MKSARVCETILLARCIVIAILLEWFCCMLCAVVSCETIRLPRRRSRVRCNSSSYMLYMYILYIKFPTARELWRVGRARVQFDSARCILTVCVCVYVWEKKVSTSECIVHVHDGNIGNSRKHFHFIAHFTWLLYYYYYRDEYEWLKDIHVFMCALLNTIARASATHCDVCVLCGVRPTRYVRQ